MLIAPIYKIFIAPMWSQPHRVQHCMEVDKTADLFRQSFICLQAFLAGDLLQNINTRTTSLAIVTPDGSNTYSYKEFTGTLNSARQHDDINAKRSSMGITLTTGNSVD